MDFPSTRVRCMVLLASGLAAALLFTPLVGLAQTDRPLPPIKRAQLDREAQHITAARAAPQPPKNQPKPARIQRQPLLERAPVASSPLPHHSAGNGTIVDSGLAPFAATQYTFENRWFKKTSNGDLVVYAGALHDDPTQGVVAVRQIGTTPGPATIYRTPLRQGSVRVVGASGDTLSLVTSNGTHLAFDVASRSFGP